MSDIINKQVEHWARNLAILQDELEHSASDRSCVSDLFLKNRLPVFRDEHHMILKQKAAVSVRVIRLILFPSVHGIKSSFHIDWDLFQIMSIRRFKLSVKFGIRLLMTYQKNLCSNIRKCLCLLFPQDNCY